MVVQFSSTYLHSIPIYFNDMGGVMVSVLSSSAVDRGFEPRSGQTKDYIYSVKLVFVASSLNSQHQNQKNVSEWGDMSIR